MRKRKRKKKVLEKIKVVHVLTLKRMTNVLIKDRNTWYNNSLMKLTT